MLYGFKYFWPVFSEELEDRIRITFVVEYIAIPIYLKRSAWLF